MLIDADFNFKEYNSLRQATLTQANGNTTNTFNKPYFTCGEAVICKASVLHTFKKEILTKARELSNARINIKMLELIKTINNYKIEEE